MKFERYEICGTAPSILRRFFYHLHTPPVPATSLVNAPSCSHPSGEEALPEEDAALFKPISEPQMLETFLLASQISNYCSQIGASSSQALLYAMQGLQRANQ